MIPYAGHPYEGIDGVYVPSATDPIANGWPHFEHKSGTWHLYRGADNIWRVSSNFLPDQTNSFCYAPASEDGLVPVGTSTWQVCPDGQTYVTGDLTVGFASKADYQAHRDRSRQEFANAVVLITGMATWCHCH